MVCWCESLFASHTYQLKAKRLFCQLMKTKANARKQPIDIIKTAIKAKYGTLKNFQETEKIPYQTLNDWNNNGIPTSVRHFFKICKILDLDPKKTFIQISDPEILERNRL